MAPFNAAQWARDHEARDDERFGAIFKILAFAGITVVALLGWSLRTQYAAIARQEQAAQVQLQEIHEVRASLATVPKTQQ